MSEETIGSRPEILEEEYIPIEVVPPPNPLPPGDGFTFGVVVGPSPSPPPPPPPGTGIDPEGTTLKVDVFLVGMTATGPIVTQLDDLTIPTYFEYLDRTLTFTNSDPKDGIGRVANNAPTASLVLVVSNETAQTASAAVVNISG